MATPPRAVLIDLDGTLVDTAPDLAAAANRVRQDAGLPALPVARIAQFIGKGTERLVHRALTDDLQGQADELAFGIARAAFQGYYRKVNGKRSRLFPGVAQSLAVLRESGLRLGCVTNKPREFSLALLENLDVLPGLDVVVAGDDVARRKPHPDVILQACRQLQVAPHEVLLVGDSANDARAGHAAGCLCLLVETGYNEGRPVGELSGAPGVGGIFPGLVEATRWILAQLPPVPVPGAVRPCSPRPATP